MSVYMSRLFPRSNSSFFLRSGMALDAKVVRLREDMYLIDAGVGQPRIATAEELVSPPKGDGPARFSNRVGFLNPSNKDSPVKNLLLQRFFVDLVTGDSRAKQQAATRFDDMVGQTDAIGGGEQPLLLPRRFRKQRVWLELMNRWRLHKKVKGFVAEKVRGGYTIGVAGYLAFLPNRQISNSRFLGDRFYIEGLSKKNFTVFVNWTWRQKFIICSASSSATELHLLGLPMERAKAAISKNCREFVDDTIIQLTS